MRSSFVFFLVSQFELKRGADLVGDCAGVICMGKFGNGWCHEN